MQNCKPIQADREQLLHLSFVYIRFFYCSEFVMAATALNIYLNDLACDLVFRLGYIGAVYNYYNYSSLYYTITS